MPATSSKKTVQVFLSGPQQHLPAPDPDRYQHSIELHIWHMTMMVMKEMERFAVVIQQLNLPRAHLLLLGNAMQKPSVMLPPRVQSNDQKLVSHVTCQMIRGDTASGPFGTLQTPKHASQEMPVQLDGVKRGIGHENFNTSIWNNGRSPLNPEIVIDWI